MGGTGGFPLDLILFGMVAAFLVLRLRSLLGRRTGFERPPRPAFEPRPGQIESTAEEKTPAERPTRPLPEAASPAGQAITRIRGVDHSFDPAQFLRGAEAAFPMIVEAYARGDRETLRNLLGEETRSGFEAAIAAREQAGNTQKFEIRGIRDAQITAADLRGTIADITVRFVSDQVNLTTAKDGTVVEGTDAVTEIVDLWTFRRDLSSQDPTWRLVGTSSGI